MFTYALKNLKSLFTKQRLLAVLLLMNIVVSCLVICFAYGLYKNFHELEKAGMEPIRWVNAHVSYDDTDVVGDTPLITCDITMQQLIDFAKSLSPETQEAIEKIAVDFVVQSPLTFYDPLTGLNWWENSYPELEEEKHRLQFEELYRDDLEPAYMLLSFQFRVEDGEIVPIVREIHSDTYDISDREIVSFTAEQYNSDEKIAIIDLKFFDEQSGLTWENYQYVKKEEADNYMFETKDGYVLVVDYAAGYRHLPEDIEEILIGGEKYKIIGYSTGGGVQIPISSLPESAQILLNPYIDNPYFLDFITYEDMTTAQYLDIQKCLNNAFDGKVKLMDVELADQFELRYYRTVAVIAVVIAILAAINMAILYRYILEKRSSELAIFRICGCSKGKAIVSYLLECTIINVPLFALTQLLYHQLIRPELTELFPHMETAYTMKTYLTMLGLYVAASLIVMLAMIWWSVKKHSLVSLKSATKATGKLGIMKVFEVLQLAIVLSIIVIVVSAISTRFEKFAPYKDLLSRKGYVMSFDINSLFEGPYMNDFREVIGDADCAICSYAEAIEFNADTFEGTTFEGTSYSQELIDFYTPPLEEGVWLNETDETYEKDGYIPIVMTYCGGEYHAGDMLIGDVIMGYDENDQPTSIRHIEYKIVGILKDNIDILSYFDEYKMQLEDYNDFSDRFIYNVTDPHIFCRTADQEAYWGESTYPLMGIQFIYFEDLDDTEFRRMGDKLERYFHRTPVSTAALYDNSMDYVFEQMYTLFPIAVCIFILTIISTVSISAIYTKRQLRNYAIFYICGARWRTCALKSLKNGAITCAAASVLSALMLTFGKSTLLRETVITFGLWHFAVCGGVIVLYLALSMIMPLSIIGSSEPREVLKEE